MDNTSRALGDGARARALADAFPVTHLHRTPDAPAARYCPALAHCGVAYHRGLMRVEYATDLILHRRDDPRPLYDALVRPALHAVKPDCVATSPGRKPRGNDAAALGTGFHTRVEAPTT